MNTKLTLTIEQDVVKRARLYAKRKERSLSDLVGNYLKDLVEESKFQQELTPVVNALKGSFKVPQNFEEKQELMHQLSQKYL